MATKPNILYIFATTIVDAVTVAADVAVAINTVYGYYVYAYICCAFSRTLSDCVMFQNTKALVEHDVNELFIRVTHILSHPMLFSHSITSIFMHESSRRHYARFFLKRAMVTINARANRIRIFIWLACEARV